MKHSCGNEMKDMGEWPTSDMKGVVHKYHCMSCNEFISEPLPEYKLEKQADGSYQQVAAH